MWNVEYTDEFGEWWKHLTEVEQEDISASVELLEQYGPRLPFPHCSRVYASKHRHMRELRIQCGGNPYRILYAFDPRRTAILLIDGNKKGDDNGYDQYIPLADKLYDEHLNLLKKEGLI